MDFLEKEIRAKKKITITLGGGGLKKREKLSSLLLYCKEAIIRTR